MIKILQPIVFILIAIICVAACDSDSFKNISADDYVYSQPRLIQDNITTGRANAEGMDEQLLIDMIKVILQNQFGEIDSVLVAVNNRLILEEYFNGFGMDITHDVKSVTKSVTSLLTGIALEQGYLDISLPVYDAFPQYDSFDNWLPMKREILVEHLLTMSSGLDCKDNDSSSAGAEDKMYRFYDWRKFTLDLPVKHEAGQVWSYCSGGVNVLGGVLETRLGMDLETFADEYFFSKLGVKNYRWSHTPSGDLETGGHLHITPRTMVKIGLMMLNHGRWNGSQIVTEDWVEKSTDPYFTHYGYLWWLGTFTYPNDDTLPDTKVNYANGFGGQRIFILPGINTVAVFTTSNYNKGIGNAGNYLTYKYIIPAFYK